jgi:hypothetical protein
VTAYCFGNNLVGSTSLITPSVKVISTYIEKELVTAYCFGNNLVGSSSLITASLISKYIKIVTAFIGLAIIEGRIAQYWLQLYLELIIHEKSGCIHCIGNNVVGSPQ